MWAVNVPKHIILKCSKIQIIMEASDIFDCAIAQFCAATKCCCYCCCCCLENNKTLSTDVCCGMRTLYQLRQCQDPVSKKSCFSVQSCLCFYHPTLKQSRSIFEIILRQVLMQLFANYL